MNAQPDYLTPAAQAAQRFPYAVPYSGQRLADRVARLERAAKAAAAEAAGVVQNTYQPYDYNGETQPVEQRIADLESAVNHLVLYLKNHPVLAVSDRMDRSEGAPA